MRKIETLVTVLTFITAVTITLTALLAIIFCRQVIWAVQSTHIVRATKTKSAPMRLLSAVREQDTSSLMTQPMPHAASTDSPALPQLSH
ncbi:hypothetical protein HY3_11565 [Hyphomonas pacifica]|uniref:Uncharacterized protein n=1 Tax=Hyphomonas pacifica TaxID=1280941 RepID=A0A062U7X1_9PROT|nr:hypothetical protein HY2_08100 [Hyphomonas pacifica]RAN34058.1 hypothetical protein HY3_11565 [Hyphomonas pacifica]RAN37145.1 hypothetical protein HY11_10180 [Hyphomonas pacifica]